MRNCILHIGTEKTGTTSVQRFLYRNRIALSQRGLYLSDRLGCPNNRTFPAYFSRNIDEWGQARNLLSLEQKDLYFSNFEAAFRDEMNAALQKHDLVVITSEHLHSRIRRKEEIEAILECLKGVFDKIQIVCYFRRQAEMALSLYSTALKFGHVTTLQRVMNQATEDNYFYDFHAIATNWSEVFGRKNCLFRIYDRRNLRGEDIRRDFIDLCQVNIADIDLEWPEAGSNESLSKASAAAYTAINLVLPSMPDKQTRLRKATRFANRALRKIADASLSSIGGRLIYEELGEIDERFRSSNSKFFEEFFGGVKYF